MFVSGRWRTAGCPISSDRFFELSAGTASLCELADQESVVAVNGCSPRPAKSQSGATGVVGELPGVVLTSGWASNPNSGHLVYVVLSFRAPILGPPTQMVLAASGKANGRYRTGTSTAEALAERRWLRDLVREARELDEIHFQSLGNRRDIILAWLVQELKI
jgi:hypothetical protein